MTGFYLSYLGVIVLALGVPYAALAAAAGTLHQEQGLAVSPFGWPHLLVVHLLAALPLNLLMAWAISGHGAERTRRVRALFWAGLGIGLAWATVSAGHTLGPTLDKEQAGFFVRLVVRVLWCMGLQLPWCLFGSCLVVGAPRLSARANGAVLAVVVAVALPAVYAVMVIDSQSQKAGELLPRMRLVQTRVLVAGLCDLGSTKEVAGFAPARLRQELHRAIQSATAVAARPLPQPATTAARIERARALAVLGRAPEAATEIEPLCGTDPQATLLFASLLQDQKRYTESSRCYREALALLEQIPGTLPARVQAYDALAFNAREQKATHEAEAVYHEALERLPQAQAHFHFQLGRHHQLGGRPAKAIDHLRTAADLDPAQYGTQARSLIDQLTLHTPGCLLRWTGP